MGLSPGLLQIFCGADISEIVPYANTGRFFLLLPILYLIKNSLSHPLTYVNHKKP